MRADLFCLDVQLNWAWSATNRATHYCLFTPRPSRVLERDLPWSRKFWKEFADRKAAPEDEDQEGYAEHLSNGKTLHCREHVSIYCYVNII